MFFSRSFFISKSSVLLATCVTLINSATVFEPAAVKDPKLIEDGYVCESKQNSIGPMKEGEEKQNYASDVCGKAYCTKGTISYYGCATAARTDGKCVRTPGDLSKPYPGCCFEVIECEKDE